MGFARPEKRQRYRCLRPASHVCAFSHPSGRQAELASPLLSRLRQRRVHIRDLDGLADRVKTFCAKVAGRLHTFDFDEKRLALQALQVKIVVGKSSARFQGAIPTNLATIEQTLGYMNF